MKKPLKFCLIGVCYVLFFTPSVSVRSQAPLLQKSEKVWQPLSLKLPNLKLENDSRTFADRLTRAVVSPFIDQQEIIDVIKAVSRYYTGGGSHQIGIKVDI